MKVLAALAALAGLAVLATACSEITSNTTGSARTPAAKTASASAPPYDRSKAAAAYWKAACDVAYGRVPSSQAGATATQYLNQIGIDPAQAYADPDVTALAKMLDKKAGTNCFG